MEFIRANYKVVIRRRVLKRCIGIATQPGTVTVNC